MISIPREEPFSFLIYVKVDLLNGLPELINMKLKEFSTLGGLPIRVNSNLMYKNIIES